MVSALQNSGHVMMVNLTSFFTLIVSTLQWLIIGIPVLILVRKFWWKLKTKFLQK